MKDTIMNEIFDIVDKCLGSKVTSVLIRGRAELVLRPQLLFTLNQLLLYRQTDSLDIVLTDSQRLKLEHFNTLLFKISHVSVWQRSVDSFEKPIDFALFKKLKNLKVSHVNLNKLVPIGHLKSQLVSLVCRDCDQTEAVFSDKLQWAELCHLSLVHCSVQPLNNSIYFKNAPWLRTLNLSFCKLSNCDFLVNLDNLEYLDLSYNFLTSIPNLSASSRNKLKTLILAQNCLDSLSGLEHLPALIGLDVSNNALPDKYSIVPLKHLEQLSWVKLRLNPVSYVEFYRMYVASCVGTRTPPSEFRIDGACLDKRELALFGTNFLQTNDANSELSERPAESAIIDAPSTSATTKSLTVASSHSNRTIRATHIRIPVIFDDDLPTAEGHLVQDTFVENKKIYPPALPSLSSPRSVSRSPRRIAGSQEQGFTCSTPAASNNYRVQSGGGRSEESGSSSKHWDVNSDSPISTSLSKTVLVEVHKTEIDVSPDDPYEVPDKLSDVPAIGESPDIVTLLCKEDDDENEPSTTIDLEPTETETERPHDTPVRSEGNDREDDKDVNDQSCSEIDESGKHDTGVSTGSNLSIPGSNLGNVEESLTETNLEENIEEIATQPVSSSSNEQDQSNDVSISVPQVDFPSFSRETLGQSGGSSRDGDDDSSYESDNDADEILWQVVQLDPTTNKRRVIFLALLEKELKERCPKSGETLSKWSLSTVLSCVKTKNDPITIEMEFGTVKKNKQHRVYIMEFADAQALTKRVYNILESRPLSEQNHVSHQCLKCSALFVHSRPGIFRAKENQILCPICGSSLVAETEEPKLPDKNHSDGGKNLSKSPSQSSILEGLGERMPTSGISTAATVSCSTVSTDPTPKSELFNPLKKYESDIEVISSRSQSSIEVIDENSRSQSVTPRRKKSEDQQPPPEVNFKAVLPPIAALTESSSSGSLTESVVTTYDTQSVVINKNSISSECLPEESCESSPVNASKGARVEENGNVTTQKLNSFDVYSYSDYADIDLRVKTFIYQKVFKNENEDLLALVKCHVWKTGGSDYDGCFVLSSSSAYFLYHNFTDFCDQVCDWLSPNESFRVVDIKRIQPIVWYQGLEIQIKEFSFILLLMDSERTQNLLKHINKLSLKGVKIISKPSSKVEMSLQNAVITSDLIHGVEDPSVISMVLCRSVEITKVDVSEEILRLASVVITCGVLLIIPGDLSWVCSASQPEITATRDLTTLIDVHKKGITLSLRFLDEADSSEETWFLKLGTEGQMSSILATVSQVWEKLFSVQLEVIEL